MKKNNETNPGKKGSIFFTLDTLIGGGLLTLTLILVLTSPTENIETSRESEVLDNVVNFYTQNDLKEVEQSNPYIYQLEDDEPDPGMSLVQKISYYEEEGGSAAAGKPEDIVSNSEEVLVPQQFGLVYIYNDTTVIYNSSPENPRESVSRNILTYFNYNDSYFGPVNTEIRVVS